MKAFNSFWKKQKSDYELPQTVIESEPQMQSAEEPTKKPEPKRKRSEIMKFRLTPEEYNYVTEQAKLSKLSKTDYFMTVARNNPVIVMDNIPDLLLELRRQGNNLNQLARIANKTGSVELLKIEEVLQQCELAQTALIEFCIEQNIKLRKSNQTDK